MCEAVPLIRDNPHPRSINWMPGIFSKKLAHHIRQRQCLNRKYTKILAAMSCDPLWTRDIALWRQIVTPSEIQQRYVVTSIDMPWFSPRSLLIFTNSRFIAKQRPTGQHRQSWDIDGINKSFSHALKIRLITSGRITFHLNQIHFSREIVFITKDSSLETKKGKNRATTFRTNPVHDVQFYS